MDVIEHQCVCVKPNTEAFRELLEQFEEMLVRLLFGEYPCAFRSNRPPIPG